MIGIMVVDVLPSFMIGLLMLPHLKRHNPLHICGSHVRIVRTGGLFIIYPFWCRNKHLDVIGDHLA